VASALVVRRHFWRDLSHHSYALGNPAAVTRYIEAGFLSIDNNASERALRAVAVGRKNYLFAGSDAGGRSAAVLYSVVGTCQRLGLDPFAYLRDAFARLPSLPAGRLDELLPDRWAAARGGAA
jgi:transposase